MSISPSPSFTEYQASYCGPCFVSFKLPVHQDGWFLHVKRRWVWKKHKSKESSCYPMPWAKRGDPHPQPSLAWGTPQQSPGRGDKGAILFLLRLAPFQMTSSCSPCLWDSSSAPSPRHGTKKNMLTGLAHRHLFWPGSRKEGDLLVWEIRNKVSGGCDLWQK